MSDWAVGLRVAGKKVVPQCLVSCYLFRYIAALSCSGLALSSPRLWSLILPFYFCPFDDSKGFQRMGSAGLDFAFHEPAHSAP